MAARALVAPNGSGGDFGTILYHKPPPSIFPFHLFPASTHLHFTVTNRAAKNICICVPLHTWASVSPCQYPGVDAHIKMLMGRKIAHSNGFTILYLHSQHKLLSKNKNLALQHSISFSETFTPFTLSCLSYLSPSLAEDF